MWLKLSKSRYENQANGAFITIFNFNGKRTPCVHINKQEYQGGCADYKSFQKLSEAKKFGDNIELSDLVRIHTVSE